jgi:peptidoglycan/LPS O-acetylase OafA/YrhL
MITTTTYSNNGTIAPPLLPRNIPSLNGLRAISIALVIVGHLAGTRNAPFFLEHLEHVGNVGVRVFFVISGFLITSLLLREFDATQRISLKAFYLRRTLRIFPAFYCYVGIILLLTATGLAHVSVTDTLHAITYTSNYHVDTYTSGRPLWSWDFNHLWSLAVEEQFYLIWPCLLVLLRPRQAILVAAIVIVMCPICRWVMWYDLGATPTGMTRRFHAVADALATGCVLAGIFNWLGRSQRYLSFASSWFGLLIPLTGLVASLGVGALGMGYYYVWGQTLANVSIALLIDRCLRWPNSPVGQFLNWRLLVFVGTLSYSLYLWQEPFLNPMDDRAFFTGFPQNLVFALTAALISYYVVESPFLRLKSRFAASAGVIQA